MDFIEKQIIIDYHLMGKQELLEKQYPHLIPKAKKFLGFECFFDLSSQPFGLQLTPANPHFNEIMKKHKEIKKSIEQELKTH